MTTGGGSYCRCEGSGKPLERCGASAKIWGVRGARGTRTCGENTRGEGNSGALRWAPACEASRGTVSGAGTELGLEAGFPALLLPALTGALSCQGICSPCAPGPSREDRSPARLAPSLGGASEESVRGEHAVWLPTHWGGRKLSPQEGHSSCQLSGDQEAPSFPTVVSRTLGTTNTRFYKA